MARPNLRGRIRWATSAARIRIGHFYRRSNGVEHWAVVCKGRGVNMDAKRYFQGRRVCKSFLSRKLTSVATNVLLGAMNQGIRQFFAFLFCLSFALSLLGCAAPMVERRASWSLLPTAAEVEADRARLAIPSELRTRLNAITAQSCKAASNAQLNRQLIGQTAYEPLEEVRQNLVIALLKWGAEQAYEKTPEERAAFLQARQLMPLPPVEWQPSAPVPEAEAPPLLEHPIVQAGAGGVSGLAIGAVPFGPAGAEVAIELRLLPKGTYWARVGKACGEIVIGTGQIIVGCAGIGAGAGMSGTGGGAAVGVPVVIGSVAIMANGCATGGHGVAELHQLWREGDVPSEAPAPAAGQWVLKKAAEKPTPQAPIAKAAPAVKPATPPAVAQQTTTTTLFKSTGKRVTKTGETTTTTTPRVKGKPSATSADAAPVAKGAKRGPKTDPEAPHNAARIKDRKKLEAEGNEILSGGGGELREKLVKTPGGLKSGRRPDTTFKTPEGAERGRNYGKTNADGTPVKREQEALDDLNKDGKLPTDFVPYDR